MTSDIRIAPDLGLSRVLAVVAHPDDESFALGAVLSALVDASTAVDVLCLTAGEASTLHGRAVTTDELRRIRALELAAAASVLGVSSIALLDHPDGALPAVGADRLSAEVLRVVERRRPEALIAFDPSGVTGHADHAAATAAAFAAADRAGLPVLVWTLPDDVAQRLNEEFGAAFEGASVAGERTVLRVSRRRQRAAAAAHASQAVPGSVLWRRLELLGDRETLVRREPRGAMSGMTADPSPL